MLLIVFITGGFVIDAGPLYGSSVFLIAPLISPRTVAFVLAGALADGGAAGVGGPARGRVFLIALATVASAKRPVARWDLLPVDVDTAVATLTAMHRAARFLVDWEAADLRKRSRSC